MFLNSLKDNIREALLKKNFVLRENDEVEKANSSYIYLTVNVSDSLYISAKRLSNNDNYISTSKYDKKVWKYSNTADVKHYVEATIKELF